MASSNSAGKKYKDAAKWYLKDEIPEEISDIVVEEINKKAAEKYGLDIVFSAISSGVRKGIEASLRRASQCFRIPQHTGWIRTCHCRSRSKSGALGIIEVQKKNRNWGGS